jgi:hypothetical protein
MAAVTIRHCQDQEAYEPSGFALGGAAVRDALLPRNPRVRLTAPRAPFCVASAGHKFRATVAANQHAPGRQLSPRATKYDQTFVRHASNLHLNHNARPVGAALSATASRCGGIVCIEWCRWRR